MPTGPTPKTRCNGCGSSIPAGQMRWVNVQDRCVGRAMCSMPCADTDSVKLPDGSSVWVPVHPHQALVMGRSVPV